MPALGLQRWQRTLARSLLVALLALGVVPATAAAPAGRAVMAWPVTVSPRWFSPAPPPDHPIRDALPHSRCAGAALSRTQDGPEPGGILDREHGRHDLRIQAS